MRYRDIFLPLTPLFAAMLLMVGLCAFGPNEGVTVGELFGVQADPNAGQAGDVVWDCRLHSDGRIVFNNEHLNAIHASVVGDAGQVEYFGTPVPDFHDWDDPSAGQVKVQATDGGVGTPPWRQGAGQLELTVGADTTLVLSTDKGEVEMSFGEKGLCISDPCNAMDAAARLFFDRYIRAMVDEYVRDTYGTGTLNCTLVTVEGCYEFEALPDPNIWPARKWKLMNVHDGDIRLLAASGRLCRVLGHSWQPYTVTQSKCRTCGQVMEGLPEAEMWPEGRKP